MKASCAGAEGNIEYGRIPEAGISGAYRAPSTANMRGNEGFKYEYFRDDFWGDPFHGILCKYTRGRALACRDPIVVQSCERGGRSRRVRARLHLTDGATSLAAILFAK